MSKGTVLQSYINLLTSSSFKSMDMPTCS